MQKVQSSVPNLFWLGLEEIPAWNPGESLPITADITELVEANGLTHYKATSYGLKTDSLFFFKLSTFCFWFFWYKMSTCSRI